jgi:guanidinoacetate N-methyltransferase
MTRKLRRTADFEVALHVQNDGFISPPRTGQRNWLLNRAIAEFTDDLTHLHALATRFMPGRDGVRLDDRTTVELADDDIMEDWQIPLMRAMAAVAAEGHGDLLEIGFGRGVSAGFIQECGVRSHTVVECNPSVIERFHIWTRQFPGRDIRLLAGRWQEVTHQFGQYDAVFFHTYPLTEQEYVETAVNATTFAEHFFPVAASCLRPGGVFTYMSNEIDSLSRGHQRALLRHFSRLSLHVQPLQVPSDVRDTWWADSMVVVKAVK